jgi:hypothetical protein
VNSGRRLGVWIPFHERLARIGLEALESHGFVLAGGYAISTNGIGDRPSADVDLFTNVYELGLFEVLDWADEIDPAIVR